MSLSSRLSQLDQAALNDPIWTALSGRHKEFAEGGPLARRYPEAIAPFAAVSETTPAAFEALKALIPPDGLVGLFTRDRMILPPDIEVFLAAELYQMIATDIPEIPASGIPPVRLGGVDAPEMMQLAEMTKPGPFGARTYELGDYLGIRVQGELIAMAGERMRIGDYVEVSAVCVHPDHRGKGYAQILISTLMRAIVGRGSVPILHVFTENAAAIALYERLGFVIRQRLHVTGLRRASSGG